MGAEEETYAMGGEVVVVVYRLRAFDYFPT